MTRWSSSSSSYQNKHTTRSGSLTIKHSVMFCDTNEIISVEWIWKWPFKDCDAHTKRTTDKTPLSPSHTNTWSRKRGETENVKNASHQLSSYYYFSHLFFGQRFRNFLASHLQFCISKLQSIGTVWTMWCVLLYTIHLSLRAIGINVADGICNGLFSLLRSDYVSTQVATKSHLYIQVSSTMLAQNYCKLQTDIWYTGTYSGQPCMNFWRSGFTSRDGMEA